MRSDRDRQAGLVLASVGAVLLAVMAVTMVPFLPELLGSLGPHAQGEAVLWVLLAGMPASFGGFMAWAAAWRLWHGSRDGRLLGALWSILALIGVAVVVATSGGGLWGPWVWIVPAAAAASVLTFVLLVDSRRRTRGARRARVLRGGMT